MASKIDKETILAKFYDDGVYTSLFADGAVSAAFGNAGGQQTYTVFQNGAAVTVQDLEKNVKVLELAAQTGSPVVTFYNSVGAKLAEGLAVLTANTKLNATIAKVSGVIPQVAVVLGVCGGTSALAAANADVCIMTKDAELFFTAPFTSAAKGDKAEGAGTAAAAAKAGAASIIAATAEEAAETAAHIVGLLPFPGGATTNPYGTTKAFTERILTDACAADPSLNVALLRYFNPIGAHKSGLIGEDPNGIPNNLMPYIAKVAVGKLDIIHVFGNDYPTPDGTGVRDYIHVVDLARGHVCAIRKLETGCGLFICNLGTGRGYSVLEVIHAFEKACGKTLPYVIEARRPGDIAECYADPTKAKNELGWVAEYGIEEMCADSWNWQSHNPDGYHTVKA